jgi:hypothetical protein
MNDQDMTALVAWLRQRKRGQQPASQITMMVIEYAESIGITITDQDAVDLFHFINHQRSILQ